MQRVVRGHLGRKRVKAMRKACAEKGDRTELGIIDGLINTLEGGTPAAATVLHDTNHLKSKMRLAAR